MPRSAAGGLPLFPRKGEHTLRKMMTMTLEKAEAMVSRHLIGHDEIKTARADENLPDVPGETAALTLERVYRSVAGRGGGANGHVSAAVVAKCVGFLQRTARAKGIQTASEQAMTTPGRVKPEALTEIEKTKVTPCCAGTATPEPTMETAVQSVSNSESAATDLEVANRRCRNVDNGQKPAGEASAPPDPGDAGAVPRQIKLIPLDRIKVEDTPEDSPDRRVVSELQESMRYVDLLSPVLVHEDNGVYEVVVGRKRVQAARTRGDRCIEAIEVTEQDPRRRELMTLDENLARAHRTPAELDKAIARRHEVLHELGLVKRGRPKKSPPATATENVTTGNNSSGERRRPMTPAERTSTSRARKRVRKTAPEVLEAYEASRITKTQVNRLAKLPLADQAQGLKEELDRPKKRKAKSPKKDTASDAQASRENPADDSTTDEPGAAPGHAAGTDARPESGASSEEALTRIKELLQDYNDGLRKSNPAGAEAVSGYLAEIGRLLERIQSTLKPAQTDVDTYEENPIERFLAQLDQEAQPGTDAV
ncbi:MAG: ParB N-terminal domain-containing protein [Candidatus Riflebacteria bacterium]|nr:ParB N-terminal domain-containing protein [Candidatus Riflebacteria bacterium]